MVQAMDRSSTSLLDSDLGIGKFQFGRGIDEYTVNHVVAILASHFGIFGGQLPSSFNGIDLIHDLAALWFPQMDDQLIMDWVIGEENVIADPRGEIMLRPVGDQELDGSFRLSLMIGTPGQVLVHCSVLAFGYHGHVCIDVVPPCSNQKAWIIGGVVDRTSYV